MSGSGESAYRVPVLIAAVKEVPYGLPTRVHRRRRVDQSRGPGDEAAFVLGAGAARGTAWAGALLLLAERFDVRAVAESGHALPRPLHGAGRTAASTELSCKVNKRTGRLALEMCVCARARACVCVLLRRVGLTVLFGALHSAARVTRSQTPPAHIPSSFAVRDKVPLMRWYWPVSKPAKMLAETTSGCFEPITGSGAVDTSSHLGDPAGGGVGGGTGAGGGPGGGMGPGGPSEPRTAAQSFDDLGWRSRRSALSRHSPPLVLDVTNPAHLVSATHAAQHAALSAPFSCL